MKVWPALSLLLLVCACTGASSKGSVEGPQAQPPAAVPEEAPPSAPAAAPTGEPDPAELRTLTGVLRYERLPRTMSVQAYNGVEFFLTTDSGEENLTESDAVSHEALEALHEKRIEVKGTWVPPQSPDPMEASPGAPRPGRWAVQAARDLSE